MPTESSSTQAAIQASRLLTSELSFGVMGRIHHSSVGLGNMVHVDDTGDDGSFFLSQIEESMSGSWVDCMYTREQLKTGLRENN